MGRSAAEARVPRRAGVGRRCAADRGFDQDAVQRRWRRPATASAAHDRSTTSRIIRPAAAAWATDPATSVVDSWGRTHDHENLFVVGAPTCVSGSCANATLTFCALALRSAHEIERGSAQREDEHDETPHVIASAAMPIAVDVRWRRSPRRAAARRRSSGRRTAATSASTKYLDAHRHQPRQRRAARARRGSGRRAKRRTRRRALVPGNFQATPLMIGDTLFLSTSYNRVVALDANTGRELWAYDPKAYAAGQPPNGTGFVHRGVATWTDGKQRRDLHQQPLEPHRARRGDRAADPRPSATRASSISRASSTATAKPVNKLHYTADVAAGRLAQPRHRRQRRRRQARVPERSAGRRAGVRRENGEARLELQPDPAQRDGRRRRHVGERIVEDHGPHERLGAVQRRRPARPRLSPGEHAEQRLVRRRANGQRSVRRIDRLPRREERKEGVALSDRASRPVGLRPPGRAGARRR